eukprot:INCI13458.14.p2 GENE.INCI13458.14~~INCI13458.14.p2  ORF type:complete len:542 (-),score=118.29 INCI13458.14:3409-5007(-)
MATQAPEAASKRRPRALNYSDFSALFKSPQNAKYRKALAAFAKKTAATAATAAAAAAAIRSTEGGVSAIDTASAPASAAEGAAGAPAAVDHQAIRQFISSFTTGLRQTAAWKEQDEREWQNTKEGVEKYAMLKLHSTVFLADAKCREVDERLVTKARHLATFLDFEHLDIDSEAEELVDAWSNASNALQRINHYKAPRDKMVCILNCCQVINGIISLTGGTSTGDDPTGGADDFLPMLIFVFVKGMPAHPWSNLEYIRRYRGADLLLDEHNYFLTVAASALSFIDTCGWSNFSILRSEYETNMATAAAEDIQQADADASKSKDVQPSEFIKDDNAPTGQTTLPIAAPTSQTPQLRNDNKDGDSASALVGPGVQAESSTDRTPGDVRGSWLRPSLNFRAGLNFVVSTGQRLRNTGQRIVENVPIVGHYASGAAAATSAAARLVAEWQLEKLKFVDVKFEALRAADVEEFHEEYQTLVGFARAALTETRRLQGLLRDSGIEDNVLSQLKGETQRHTSELAGGDGSAPTSLATTE